MTTLAEDPLQAIIEHVEHLMSLGRIEDPLTNLLELRRRFLPGGCIEGRMPLIGGTTRVIPVQQPGIRGEWVLAEGARPDRRLLYVHGGYMALGDAEAYRHMMEPLSRALQAAVLAIDYRLAPEHRFPAAPDDCLAAWRWMERNGPAGAGDAAQLWLAGDSAGGNLVLVLLQDLKRLGGRTADAAASIAPVTDLTGDCRRAAAPLRRDPFISLEACDWMTGLYLPPGHDPRDPRASPLFGDLAGLPPTLVEVGEREVLLDDARLYVERAVAAGSPARLVVKPRMPHVFQWWCHVLPEARQSLEEIAAFLMDPKT